MTGPLADPGLSRLVLFLVLPASLLMAVACFAMWRSRRDWVVLDGIVRSRPQPGAPPAPTEIGVRHADGSTAVVHLHLVRPRGHPMIGTALTLSHPPGRPELMQEGSPTPLLVAAWAGAVGAVFCIAVVAGV